MRSPRERAAIGTPDGFLQTAGDVGVFAGRLARELRRAAGHGGEVLRQAALIATGSTAVIMAIAFFAGGSCGLESSSLARAFGAAPIAGGFSSWCTLREVVPFVFGYILAAKVGCGMVAELGAMRVDEEVDALEAMGVRSLAWLAGTRALACALLLPVAYVLALASAQLAAYLMSVVRFGDVSPGTWSLFFFTFQDGVDLVFSRVKGLVISVFVGVGALDFGYGGRGGPEDVGIATARSMAVNIVGVTVISMAGTLIFWGANPRLPFG
ncbi:MAG: phospholipid/cholesterol/gamma-HCH transport system permease protein [Solirubrobacteraceae bacterium]|nr:phospholipid/cholesterol/gamma-HCH transport system permease protein [Solirubrobacteraceae bacterium]